MHRTDRDPVISLKLKKKHFSLIIPLEVLLLRDTSIAKVRWLKFSILIQSGEDWPVASGDYSIFFCLDF